VAAGAPPDCGGSPGKGRGAWGECVCLHGGVLSGTEAAHGAAARPPFLGKFSRIASSGQALAVGEQASSRGFFSLSLEHRTAGANIIFTHAEHSSKG
jgi:hypothetical protein